MLYIFFLVEEKIRVTTRGLDSVKEHGLNEVGRDLWKPSRPASCSRSWPRACVTCIQQNLSLWNTWELRGYFLESVFNLVQLSVLHGGMWLMRLSYSFTLWTVLYKRLQLIFLNIAQNPRQVEQVSSWTGIVSLFILFLSTNNTFIVGVFLCKG